jgi:hypothetical protein
MKRSAPEDCPQSANTLSRRAAPELLIQHGPAAHTSTEEGGQIEEIKNE